MVTKTTNTGSKTGGEKCNDVSFLIMQENILIGPFNNKSTTILCFRWWETNLYWPTRHQRTKIFSVSPDRRLQKYAGNPISKCKTPSKIVSKLISTLQAIFRTFKDCISLAGLRPTNYCMRPKNNNQNTKFIPICYKTILE